MATKGFYYKSIIILHYPFKTYPNINCVLSYSSDDLLVDNPVSVVIVPPMICVSVEANDDLILENDEEYTFVATTSDSAVTQIAPDGGRIIIVDNDREFQ